MQIRELRPSDLPAIHALNQAAVPAVGTLTQAALDKIVESSLIALVIQATEEPSGCAGFCLVLAPGADYGSENYRWFSQRHEDFIYLDRVAIAPAYQGQGLGTQLYQKVESLAAQRRPQAAHFALEVNLKPRNDPSLAFHAKLGFQEVAQRDTNYGARVSMMEKKLASGCSA